MIRLIIGEHEEKGWCVIRVSKEKDDADIMVVGDYASKAEAWNKAWDSNHEYADEGFFYMAVCKIDLEMR